MRTWDELRAHIRRTYNVSVDEPRRIGLLWQFPNAPDMQREYVRPVTALGSEHVQITANVVPTNAMTAYEGMLHNARLAIGALHIADGFYLMSIVLPLGGIDVSFFDRALEVVAHEAARLRSKAVPKAAPAPYYE